MTKTFHLSRALIATSLCLVAVASNASAVEAETLEQAWEQALSSNFKIEAARQEQKAAEAQVKSARAQRIPNFALAAEHLRLDSSPTITTTFSGNPLTVTYWDQESTYYGASTTLPLYTGGRITADINAARAQESASSANTSHTISNVKLDVARAYITVLKSQSGLKLAQSHVKSLSAHQTDVDNLLKQGLVANNQLLMARVALAGANQALLKAEHQVQLAAVNYNRLLNRPLDAAVQLAPLDLQPVTLNLGQLNDDALNRRADLKALRHRVKVLEENAEVAKATSKPQLGLSGTYLHHDNRIMDDNDMLATHLTMLWQVFDGGASRQRGDQIQRQAAALSAQQAELRDLVVMQVKQAWLALETAKKSQDMTALNIEQAEENLRVSNNRYQAGLITNTEVLEAENLRLQAHHDHNSAIHEAVMANLELKHAAGML